MDMPTPRHNSQTDPMDPMDEHRESDPTGNLWSVPRRRFVTFLAGGIAGATLPFAATAASVEGSRGANARAATTLPQIKAVAFDS